MSHTARQSKYTRRYRPCHPLAQHAVNQIDTLKLRPQDIVKAMGYALKYTIPACDRLRHVLSNRYLGLDGSYMDKCFTADEFLAKLFLVLDIPYEPFYDDIKRIKDELTCYPNAQVKYRLTAAVDFDFGTANWISRSGASRLAHIDLPKQFAKLSDAARDSIVQESIREHYQYYDGSLPYDGIINGYQLVVEHGDERVDRVEYELPKASNM